MAQESELYRTLSALTKRKEEWKKHIPYVRRPEMVRPYLEILQSLAENDPNPVVRIHSAGAIRITSGETTARRD